MISVTIKATETVQELAQKALDIQDAANGLAVANFLIEVQRHFREWPNGQEQAGSEMSVQNPVSVAVLNKLNHLAAVDQDRTDCFDACEELARGEDVEWQLRPV